MGLTIGVDIGGTKIAAGVVDEEGSILSTHKVPSPSPRGGSMDDVASAGVDARAGDNFGGVRISADGNDNRQLSEVCFAPDIDWRSEQLRAKVEALVDLPGVVESGVTSAGW